MRHRIGFTHVILGQPERQRVLVRRRGKRIGGIRDGRASGVRRVVVRIDTYGSGNGGFVCARNQRHQEHRTHELDGSDRLDVARPLIDTRVGLHESMPWKNDGKPEAYTTANHKKTVERLLDRLDFN